MTSDVLWRIVATIAAGVRLEGSDRNAAFPKAVE